MPLIQYAQYQAVVESEPRITEANDFRITEAGDLRYTEPIATNNSGVSSLVAAATLIPMMATLPYVKVNGIWKLFVPYVKHSGIWKQPNAIYKKVSGNWKRIY